MQAPVSDSGLNGVDILTGRDMYRNMHEFRPGTLDYESEKRNTYNGIGKEC